MKYEFKPFHNDTYLSDLNEGWLPTLRISSEYEGQPLRQVEVFDLGPNAKHEARIAVIDLRDGDVRLCNSRGLYFEREGEGCLDVILYREAGPKKRTVHGIAYLSANGIVTAIRNAEDHLAHLELAGDLTPVPCTITLHEST